MSVEKVPRSWRLRSFWQKFPRTLLVVLTLLLLPTVVQELVMAWDWYAIHAAARRLERWGDDGEPPHGVQVAVALEPRLWVRLARAGWGLRDALHDWCPSLVDTPHVISITLVGPRYDDAALEFATNTFPQVRQLRLEGCAVSPADRSPRLSFRRSFSDDPSPRENRNVCREGLATVQKTGTGNSGRTWGLGVGDEELGTRSWPRRDVGRRFDLRPTCDSPEKSKSQGRR